ncbi:TAXI family TRAP transporter solute-binding subunit [Bacillus fonticola]|uniref:TAXI family TRAP transporter solute-binding subunit n=1 Tax=Bacillus fonticola TaxID=2728853 RepID=UPI001472A1FA|nr:TAXI family TRAP transporter solute-binding subunit [Bacillus fonticola]
MKRKRFMLLFGTMLVAALVLAGCGSDTEEGSGGNGDGGEDGTPEFLSLLTGGSTGTYYPLGGAMAQIIEDETGINTDSPSTNASADNMNRMAAGEAQLAFSQTDVASYAVNGEVMFEEPIDSIQAIGALYPETVQMVTTADSGIESVEDMAGKKVSVGAPGSGTYASAEQILEIHGMTMEDIEAQNLDFSESTEGIQSGTIDAAFITSGTPTGAVEGLAATVDVRIIPISQEKIEELIAAYPFYAEEIIPAGTYGLEEEVTTVAVLAMLVADASLSEDVVYDVTKAIFENTDALANAHSKGELISAEAAVKGIGIDFHPGAEKYFKEQGLLE